MRVDLDGFEDVQEAREAAMLFLRETAKKKAHGPLNTYAHSYDDTSATSSATHEHFPENSSPLVALWRRTFGGVQG